MLHYFFRLEKITPPLHEYSKLEEMLALRALGYSYTVLADRYNVPKTTIRYLVRRFGLTENKVQATVTRSHTTTQSPKYQYVEETINPGKTYAEYIKEEQERRRRKLYRN
jgi:Zn-dependent peptidase ImmA (M78 family)